MLIGLTTKKMLAKIPWHYIVPIFFIIAAFYWLLQGYERVVQITTNTTNQEARRIINELSERDPVLGAELYRIQESYGARALSVKLVSDSKHRRQDINYTNELKNQLDNGHVPYEVRLAHLADTTGMTQDEPRLDAFINEYGTMLAAMDDKYVSNQLLSLLEHAASNSTIWDHVHDNFFGLATWMVTQGEGHLWQFWINEKDWFTEELTALDYYRKIELEADELNSLYDEYLDWMLTALETGYKYRTLIKQISNEVPDFAGLNLELFIRFGDTIQRTHDETAVPLDEVMAVLYANPTWCDTVLYFDADPVFHLSRIYREQHNVWQYAMMTDYALQLYWDVPQFADDLLDAYAETNFIPLLYAFYGEENALPVAVESIVKYGDLAVYVLGHYKDDPRMESFLANPNFGYRVILFIAMMEHRNPFQLLESNPAYLNRYVDDEGRARDTERWWEALPGGSIAKVASNWANGYPNEWSELGWSMFDVVTIPAIVISLGKAAPAQVAIRTGSRTALRSTNRAIAQRAVQQSVRHSAQAGAQATVRTTAGMASMLGRTTQTAGTVARSIGRGAVYLAQKAQSRASISYTRLHTSWNNLPAAKRLFVIRTATAVAVFSKLYMHSDALALAPQQIGEFIGKTINVTMDGIATSFASAIKEVFNVGASESNLKNYVIWIIVTIFLLLLSYMSWRLLRPSYKLQHI